MLDPATKRYKFYKSREGAEAAQEAPSDAGSQAGEPSEVDGGDAVGAEHGGRMTHDANRQGAACAPCIDG